MDERVKMNVKIIDCTEPDRGSFSALQAGSKTIWRRTKPSREGAVELRARRAEALEEA